MLYLQGAIGNAAVARLVSSRSAPPAQAVQRRPLRTRTPFERVLALHQQVVDTLDRMLQEIGAFKEPDMNVVVHLLRLGAARNVADRYNRVVPKAVDDWVAGNEPQTDEDVDLTIYFGASGPNAAKIHQQEEQIERLIAMCDLVRPRVVALARMPDLMGPNLPTAIRQTFYEVAFMYVEPLYKLYSTPIAETMQRLAFLDSFYEDPRVIEGYAMFRYADEQLPILYQNLRASVRGGTVFPEKLSDLKESMDPPDFSTTEGFREEARMKAAWTTGQGIANVRDASDAIGDPPDRLEKVKKTLRPADVPGVARILYDLQVRVPVQRLWEVVPQLRSLIYSHNAIGMTLNPFVSNANTDRAKWLRELDALEDEFIAELKKGDHPRIQAQVDDWSSRLQALLDVIPAEARKRHIQKAIAEQLPFMFVAGATTMRIGAWVRLYTTSRWLVALAEGLTMTAFTALGTGPGSPGRPKSALGWVGHAALNILWARVGRAFFDIAGSVTERLGWTRLALLNVGTKVIVPGVALATLQSTAQLIEQKARSQGGESTFTELLTMNLVLHGLGITMGLATMPPGGGSTPRTAAELAKAQNIPEDVARLWLEIATVLGRWEQQAPKLRALVASGQMTQAQFDQLKAGTLQLAEFLEVRFKALAGAGAVDATPAQVEAAFAAFREQLSSAKYSPGGGVTLLLPQNVEGLVRVGESRTWTYDPSVPPKNLAALKAALASGGRTVRALPSGGFEATNPNGELYAQVLPVAASLAAALPKTLESIAKGPLAQSGLAKVRAQTAVPASLLEIRLRQAAGTPEGERAVVDVLQHIARFVEPNSTSAWEGLLRFFENDGDPKTLRRAMAFGQAKEFAAESKLLANKLLDGMATWDRSAFNGFKALYRARPNLTAERLLNLVGELTPEQVQGVMHALEVLEPRSRNLRAVIGPLTSGAESSIRGALGALTSGAQLAERFPGSTLVFEDPVFDPTGREIRRIDISVRMTETTRVAGQTQTREVEIGAFEIKEVSTSSFGDRAPQELARDIVRDWQLRSQRVAPVAGSRPLFETFRWRIRRVELEGRAMRRLGTNDPKDPRVDAEMRNVVADALRKSFDRYELNVLPEAERQAYRNAFEAGVPFVEFF